MDKRFLHASGLAAMCILLAACLCACAGSRTASSDTGVGSPVITFPNAADQENVTRILSNPFDQQAGVSGTALMLETIENGESANQLAVDLQGNVGIRGHFVSLLVPVPRSGVDSVTDAEDLLGALPILVYRLNSDPPGTLPRIGSTNSTQSGAASAAQPVSLDLTTSVAVDVAATKQLIREVSELKAEVAELKRDVGRH